MRSEVTLHQAVFGYDAGHNLLAASCPIPPESLRTLAVLTDASGPWPAVGFGQVFTGTSLPDMQSYALFCTWPAPEMPRPGCVWSHVLLIELADLAALADLGELRDCFRRPTKTDEPLWREPLRFVAIRRGAPPIAPIQQADCQRFLTALYATPELPFVTHARDAALYEDLVFALWSQQWPRLRRNFRFSTGSFGDRSRSGATFDLQITPAATPRARLRDGSDLPPHRADSLNKVLPTVNQAWIRIALDDLIRPDENEFRSFLRAYGTDVVEPRNAFARLTVAYEQLELDSNLAWTDKLCAIGKLFPDEKEALRLKEWMLTIPKTVDPRYDSERAWAIVAFVLGTREAKAFSSVSFDHTELAPFLWKDRREEVLSLLARLVRQQQNPNAKAFLAGIANAIGSDELLFISNQRPELIPILLSHRVALAFDVATWQLPHHTQWQIAEVLFKLSLDQKEWGCILTAMFLAATPVAVREVVEKAGTYAIPSALCWLDNEIAQQLLPSQAWREALAGPATRRLDEPELLPPASLALCAWFIPPETVRNLLSASRKDIQQLAQLPLDALPLPLRSHTAFLLVTLGLRATDADGLPLLLRGFYEVHDALAGPRFAPESWQLISPELPELGWWSDWDRCKRLRRAVRQWLSEHATSAGPFIEAAKKAEHYDLARQITNDDPDNSSG